MHALLLRGRYYDDILHVPLPTAAATAAQASGADQQTPTGGSSDGLAGELARVAAHLQQRPRAGAAGGAVGSDSGRRNERAGREQEQQCQRRLHPLHRHDGRERACLHWHGSLSVSECREQIVLVSS